MKKISFIKIVSIIFLISSIGFISFGYYKIYSAKIRYKNSLKIWDEKKDNIEIKDVIQKQKVDDVNPKLEDVSPKYSETLKDGEVMGRVVIKSTGEKIPIIYGTSDDDLSKGAGYYIPSAMIGKEGNSIIFGHRDGAFSGLKNVDISGEILVETYQGKFIYKVYETKIVEPEDKYIVRQNKKDELTLVTCYPFYFIGDAPQRFIVKAELIK